MQNKLEIYNSMFPVFYHIVERISTPSWRIENSKYDRHNIILIYEGKAEFGCNEQRFIAECGSMIFFKPGDKRFGFTYADHPMKCYAVDFDFIFPVKKASGWNLEYAGLPFGAHEKIENQYLFSRLLALFNDLVSIWLSKKNNMEIRLRAVFSEIIHLLLTYKTDSDVNFDKMKKVENAINYMVKHLSTHVRLTDISNAVNVSPSYLGSIFKEITGKSPIEYHITIKLKKAKDLLREGVSVSETAYQLGFNDIYYFSKCFKKNEGISPSEYKRNHKVGDGRLYENYFS